MTSDPAPRPGPSDRPVAPVGSTWCGGKIRVRVPLCGRGQAPQASRPLRVCTREADAVSTAMPHRAPGVCGAPPCTTSPGVDTLPDPRMARLCSLPEVTQRPRASGRAPACTRAGDGDVGRGRRRPAHPGPKGLRIHPLPIHAFAPRYLKPKLLTRVLEFFLVPPGAFVCTCRSHEHGDTLGVIFLLNHSGAIILKRGPRLGEEEL